MTAYRIQTKVVDVYHHTKLVRAHHKERGDPNSEIVQQYEDVGWFVRVQGSWEALYVGDMQPGLKVGDAVEIVIRKV